MIKMLKEIFSSENIKKAMLLASLSSERMTTEEYVTLVRVIRDEESTVKKENVVSEGNELKKAS